ncbi:MAG: hypothetical protein JST19_09980, partial [Bacteroidetes bacterium]|nr:hypothetical protein [Bacteroidota bacterium]
MKTKLLSASVILISIFALSGCKKLVEVPSPDSALTSDNVYTNDATAAAVLTGMYSNLTIRSPLQGASTNSISLCSGLSADELSFNSAAASSDPLLAEYYLNQLNSGSSAQPDGS